MRGRALIRASAEGQEVYLLDDIRIIEKCTV